MKKFILLIFPVILLSCQHKKKAEMHYREGLTHLTALQYDDAIESFSKAVEFDKYHARAFFSRGLSYSAMADYEPAYKDLQQALNINPLMPEAHLEIGKIQLKRYNPNYQRAIKSYTRALDINQDYAEAYLHRGILRGELMETESAIIDLGKAISLKPDQPEAYFHRAKNYERSGKMPDAINDLNKAIELKNDYGEAYNLKGLINLRLENYRHAAADFEQAVNLMEKPGREYYNLGFSKSKINDHRGALAAYNTSLEWAPGIAITHFERGNTWEKLGNMKQACNDWKKAADIGNPYAMQKYRATCEK